MYLVVVAVEYTDCRQHLSRGCPRTFVSIPWRFAVVMRIEHLMVPSVTLLECIVKGKVEDNPFPHNLELGLRKQKDRSLLALGSDIRALFHNKMLLFPVKELNSSSKMSKE